MKRNPENREVDKRPKNDRTIPPAGPHDKPGLTDPAKTPGTGILPDEDVPVVDGPTG
jgi:hypothetical protein